MFRWFVPVAVAAVVTLFGAAGMALEAEVITPPAPVEPMVPDLRRCTYCGWIESKREILSGAADAGPLRIYEYTVRMNDASSSVFREELPVSWRARRCADLDHECNCARP
jgi:hypothetical protein